MEEQRRIKSYDELEFCDDFMFKKVMEDPLIGKMVLERILGVQIAKIEYRNSEESFKEAPDAKGIRLDVYLANEDTRFDIEMQTRPQDYIGKRAEFYQSNMVIDSLESGALYADMKNCIVIFICLNDPFTDGLCRYTFTKICHEKQSVKLEDGMTTIILNAAGDTTNEPPEMVNFLKYIAGRNANYDDKLIKLINEKVKAERMNAVGRKEYNMQSLALYDAKREGELCEQIKTAYRNKNKGMSADDVAEFMGKKSEYINRIYNLIDECSIKDDSDASIAKVMDRMRQ